MKAGRVVFALALLAAACGGGREAPRAKVTIKGSDTMVILGQRFAEEYMKRNGGVAIQVNGGGSGTGIAALINGTVDLAQASRPMKDKEKADVKAKRGVDVRETRVALDALAVFVNEQNALRDLTVEQLAEIYKTAPAPWVLYGRDN
ncbi:MAG TPA: substrate-binding domain-containing protein, partial [Thermoanaerobaculia bacterium]|nr:substrate-binding domain-containing protein [Thermoanaerobaculia bacterium]